MNHFELFGLPTQFKVDGNLLSSQFRELQRRFHPDKFATASAQEQLMAVQKATMINDAYQTIKNPASRAEYILAENQHDIRSEQQTLQDPIFLMQQMELREELEEIGDSDNADELLFDFESNVSKMHQQQLQLVEQQLNDQHWTEAADSVRKLKFIAKLLVEIERLEERLLD
ncbi:Fe-S protein assembly co-chaperone HscB [Vibrio sp. UCD-FRSSP16_10]|uniref:co-chaperone HscB n=1 Tax=unclassified Vibrio TaxID=2614977 RepID=UPI0008007C56|nr:MULTISPECIES: co-chaperone HscB [unclassified Vibrio]OBT17242.1 Fe-S protein assembly co-chaperone HscB [Vibrio sp. UCD-FRSSP16_30]OBT23011.1 Fe-S protein assembly co-chaperone HscB [Vibrio sp. UCD-FRSSP16_10]